jgi:ribosomal protein S18 acetylase RimI-like enzyme
MDLDARVRAAHGDAWQAEGRLREPFGGGALELPGVRLMASGLPFPQWNNGDVTDVAAFPLDDVRAWYATRAEGRGVPWGVRVPAGFPFAHGRHLFRKRCMALSATEYRPRPSAPGLRIRAATLSDADAVAAIDAAAFDTDFDACRAWNTPHIGAPGFTVILAELDDEAVGCATSILTRGRAGPCVGIFGVGVIGKARRRGAGAALTAWLLARGFAQGATLAHLNPNTPAAAALYAGLGFREAAGFDVYVEL